jgi:hypothetical protein
MSKSDFVKDHLSYFIAPDGGGMLDSNDIRPPIGECTLYRTHNENPILYLVHPAINFCLEFNEFKSVYADHYNRHMASTYIEPGRHSRRCGDKDLIKQSHDNIVAQLIGGWFFKSAYAREVFNFGKKYDWNFNIKEPGKFELKCQLQGGDIAIAHYAVEEKCPMWCALWLALGLSVSKNWNMCDLRITFLCELLFKKITFLQSSIILIGIVVHGIRRGTRVSKAREFDFPITHPFVKFLEAS